jgi:hypothetical protein
MMLEFTMGAIRRKGKIQKFLRAAEARIFESEIGKSLR